MTTLTTRVYPAPGKGSNLTHQELDTNFRLDVVEVTGNLNPVTVAHNRSTLVYTSTGGHTITLPDGSAIVDYTAAGSDTGDFEVTIVNRSSNDSSLTIAPDSGDTINGSASNLTLRVNESVTLKVGTGTDLWVIKDSYEYTNKVATTTLTFAAVGASSEGTAQDWAHGLNGDSIDFNFQVLVGTAGVSHTLIDAVAMDHNGYVVSKYTSGLPTDPSVPATHRPAGGNIRVNVKNNSGVAVTSYVRVWARIR